MHLSLDFRRSILAAYKSGGYTVKRITEIFGVAKDTVHRLVRHERETGSLAPRKGGRPALSIWTDANLHQIIRDLVSEDNDATLEELCDRLDKKAGARISVPQMCELLQDLRLYRKKKLCARTKAIAKESSKLVRSGGKERKILIRTALSS